MLLRDPFRSFAQLAAVADAAFDPPLAADAYVRDGQLVVHVDVPGVAEDAVDVHLDGRDLVIAVERHYTPEPGDRVLLARRSWGEMSQRLRLPAGVDADAITAELDRGVLTVSVPLSSTDGPRRIPIAASRVADAPAELDAAT